MNKQQQQTIEKIKDLTYFLKTHNKSYTKKHYQAVLDIEDLLDSLNDDESTSYSVVIINDNEKSKSPSVFKSKQEVIKAIKNKYEKELWNHIKSSNSDLPFSNRLNCAFSVYQNNGNVIPELVYEHYYDVISKKHYQINKLF